MLTITFTQPHKLETGTKAGGVAYYCDDADRFVAERKINLHRIADIQVALYQSAEARFADIEADGMKREWFRRG